MSLVLQIQTDPTLKLKPNCACHVSVTYEVFQSSVVFKIGQYGKIHTGYSWGMSEIFYCMLHSEYSSLVNFQSILACCMKSMAVVQVKYSRPVLH